MNQRELILGYDIRETPAKSAKHWDRDRIDRFLYRTDVRCPLSADTSVWPSQLAIDDRPPTSIAHQDLWADLEAVLKQQCDGYLISIGIDIEKCREKERQYWQSVTIATSVAPLHYTFLGYDVGDMWLLSALSNCGFLPDRDDVTSLRNKWSNRLNEYHLFNEYRHADEFKELSDSRIKEHAPFFIFGIWLIKSLP